MTEQERKDRELEQEIIQADQNWEEHLEGIMAEGFGLTVDEYREFKALETDEEKDAYMADRAGR